jgi:hypothetical protein
MSGIEPDEGPLLKFSPETVESQDLLQGKAGKK